jgi:hypothetical protein
MGIVMQRKNAFDSSVEHLLLIAAVSFSHNKTYSNEHYGLLGPSRDNVPVLAVVNTKNRKHIFFTVCCVLNFLLIIDCRCFHSLGICCVGRSSGIHVFFVSDSASLEDVTLILIVIQEALSYIQVLASVLF